jgi:hypothetical protein
VFWNDDNGIHGVDFGGGAVTLLHGDVTRKLLGIAGETFNGFQGPWL